MDEKKMQSERLERLLDAALAHRAQAEPLAGYEERLLARLATAEAPVERLRWLPWLAFAAAAVVIAIVVTVALSHRKPEQPQQLVHREVVPAPQPKQIAPIERAAQPTL